MKEKLDTNDTIRILRTLSPELDLVTAKALAQRIRNETCNSTKNGKENAEKLISEAL